MFEISICDRPVEAPPPGSLAVRLMVTVSVLVSVVLDPLATVPWTLAVKSGAAVSSRIAVEATVLDSLPDYDGSGWGLLWEEDGLRVVLFGTYGVDELANIAEALTLYPPAAPPPAGAP